MATTGAGTPYVESSDLVANYPAVSESLAERVDLVGVLPFADSTARGTALPSPTDGQYSYLQDTNATEYWDGSAWVAAGVAPGLVHVNTTTFSAVSSVSVDDVFTSEFQAYKIITSGVSSAASSPLRFRLRLSGSDNSTASSYVRQVLEALNTTVSAGRLVEDAGACGGIASTLMTLSHLELTNVAMASATGFTSYTNTPVSGALVTLHAGTHNQTTAYDGITIYPTSGTITGTIRIYGYKN